MHILLVKIFLNQESGGIKDISQFENNDPSFKQRERLDVYFDDASSKLKGNRFLLIIIINLKKVIH